MKYLAVPFLCLAAAGVAAYASSLSGCGGPTVEEGTMMMPDLSYVSTYSCDQQSKQPPQCKEFSDISPSQPESGLETLCSAPLTVGPCTRTNSLGGCRSKTATYTFTTWFYSGTMYQTAAQVQTYCGSAYVPPN